jgi:ABC-type spermidine/putrescine transport system permease subunit II
MSETHPAPSLKTYTTIYIALLALTAATIIGSPAAWRIQCARGAVIAFTKTVLVAMFFCTCHARCTVVAVGALVGYDPLSIYHDYLTVTDAEPAYGRAQRDCAAV